jgi:hypothetical protein
MTHFLDCDNCGESYGPDERTRSGYLKDVEILHIDTHHGTAVAETVTVCKGSGPKSCEAQYAASEGLKAVEQGSQEQQDGVHYTTT